MHFHVENLTENATVGSVQSKTYNVSFPPGTTNASFKITIDDDKIAVFVIRLLDCLFPSDVVMKSNSGQATVIIKNYGK